MAEKLFVIYAANAGTATARPVIAFFNEDEGFVPDLVAMGYPAGEAGHVVRDTAFAITDTADEATGRSFTIDPTALTVAETTFSRTDLETDRREVSIRIADLIRDWDWTQRTDARITRATQEAFASWINALENVPGDPLWATDPMAIVLPAVPTVTASPTTVAEQIASADWIGDGNIFSQKLGLANWDTLQPLWGFDTADLTPFGSQNVALLAWGAGRSGARGLRFTTTPDGTTASVWAGPAHSFALAASESFQIEGWFRASQGSVEITLGIAGYASRTDAQVVTAASPNTIVGTAWSFATAIVQVPAGSTARWGSARVASGTIHPSIWVEIDSLTIRRLPRLMNAYAQSTVTTEITPTSSALADAQTLLSVSFTRHASSTVRLASFVRIVPQNTATDVMRLLFWISVMPVGGAETALAFWAEYAPTGAWTHRGSGFEYTDASTASGPVIYQLKASKSTGTGTMSVAQRSLTALLLPKVA